MLIVIWLMLIVIWLILIWFSSCLLWFGSCLLWFGSCLLWFGSCLFWFGSRLFWFGSRLFWFGSRLFWFGSCLFSAQVKEFYENQHEPNIIGFFWNCAQVKTAPQKSAGAKDRVYITLAHSCFITCRWFGQLSWKSLAMPQVLESILAARNSMHHWLFACILFNPVMVARLLFETYHLNDKLCQQFTSATLWVLNVGMLKLIFASLWKI